MSKPDDATGDTLAALAVAQTMHSPSPAQVQAALSLPAEVKPAAPAASLQEPVATSMDNTPPVLDWDRYELLSPLGQGGMGMVWKARDRQLSRVVAIKFIRGGDRELVGRFQQEARAQARIDHPQICRVYEIGEVAGKPYIAMQFIAGRTLAKAGLTRTQILQVICDVAFGLHEAHRLGILHRDLKPDNIMVERREDGRLVPVIMDFGLARETAENTGLTETGQLMGTPAYMAPEQARGDVRRLDRRADVYSLGATLYDLLAGRPPFVGQQILEVVYAVANREAPDLRRVARDLPLDLCAIVMKCLTKEPSERYDSAKEFGEDLQRYINGERVLARPKSWVQRLRKWARDNWQFVAAAGLAVIWLAAFLAQLVSGKLEERRQERRSRLRTAQAQYMAQEVKNLEWLMRSAYQLPPHDVSRERTRVLARLDALDRQLQGDDALGPALRSEALGRGALTLQDYPQAQERLLQAVQLGHETPSLDYALGIALGKTFERAIDELGRSGDIGYYQKHLPLLREKHLPPIAAYLGKGRAADRDSAAFVDALLAYYGGDFPGAMARAQAIFADSPWMYEAKKIEADSHLQLAKVSRQSGSYDRAAAELNDAQRLYDEAVAIGRSDPALLEAIVDTWDTRLAMARERNKITLDDLTPAIAACDRAIAVAPFRAYGYAKKSWMYQYVASLSSAYIDAGLQAARRAIDLEPDGYLNYDIHGASLQVAARHSAHSGRDPTAELQRAADSLKQGLSLRPDFAPAYNKLGNVYLSLVTQGRRVGRETFEEFLAGSGYYERAIQISPDFLLPYTNLIAIVVHRIEQLQEAGRFDNALFEKTRQVHRQCKAKNPTYLHCDLAFLRVLGVRLAAHEAADVAIGQDYDDITELLASIDRQHKDDIYAIEEELAAHTVLAQHQLRAHENASAVIKRLDQTLSRCMAKAGPDTFCVEADVRRCWVNADAAVAASDSPLPWLTQAVTAAQQAVVLSPGSTDPLYLLAESLLRLGQAETVSKRRERALQEGQWVAEQGLRIHRSKPPLLLTHGTLLLERSKLLATPEERNRLALRARGDIERALGLNPLLRRLHARTLDEARALTGGSGSAESSGTASKPATVSK